MAEIDLDVDQDDEASVLRHVVASMEQAIAMAESEGHDELVAALLNVKRHAETMLDNPPPVKPH